MHNVIHYCNHPALMPNDYSVNGVKDFSLMLSTYYAEF